MGGGTKRYLNGVLKGIKMGGGLKGITMGGGTKRY